MTVQEAKESIEYLKMQLTEDLEMICFTGDELKAIDIAIECMEELEQYRALGTVEELKEAREKQVAKKPTEVNEITYGTFYRMDFLCPACNTSNIENPYKPNYCKHCGQALKWGEEE